MVKRVTKLLRFIYISAFSLTVPLSQIYYHCHVIGGRSHYKDWITVFFSNSIRTLFHLLTMVEKLVSLNKLLSGLDKNVSNSGEVAFGTLQFSFLGGGLLIDTLLFLLLLLALLLLLFGWELLNMNLALNLFENASKSFCNWSQLTWSGVGIKEDPLARTVGSFFMVVEGGIE